MNEVPGIRDLQRCFTGVVPAVIATTSAKGVPNVTYLSRVHLVDDERIALSNQFFSKTACNLAENPRASLLLVDPSTHDEFRLTLAYERTDRRGVVFDRLRADVDAIAAMTGMKDVFRLRAADIYRVIEVEVLEPHPDAPAPEVRSAAGPDTLGVGELCSRIARCGDLDSLISTVIDGLVDVLGYQHVHLLLLDEEGRRLYTIASRGFEADSIGAEVPLGDGVIGMAAERGSAIRVGNLGQMAKYSQSIQRTWAHHDGVQAERAVPMPGLPGAESRVAVPAMAAGALIGVLSADSTKPIAFGPADDAALGVVASMFATTHEVLRVEEGADDSASPAPTTPSSALASGPTPMQVRFFAVDGSTFLDGDYIIKGVAGRILWSLLQQYQAAGRSDFSNKELRLDPSLDMPGFKDNLESRLILLRRRLDERDAPIRLIKTGRGLFRLEVDGPVSLVES